MNKVIIALGSNMGDSIKNLSRATQMLESDCLILKRSKVYQTPPVGYTNQADFFNAALIAETALTPLALLKLCKKIESEMGRVSSFCNAPRPIDLDIIFYAKEKLSGEVLSIPHPRWAERDFVLTTLLDLFEDSGNFEDFPDELRAVLKKTSRAFAPISSF